MTTLTNEPTNPLTGLTSAEAAKRLKQYGSNAIPEAKRNLLLVFLKKFWAPVPWMLEITIILEIYLGKNTEAIVIGALLVFNAILSFSLGESRPKCTVSPPSKADGADAHPPRWAVAADPCSRPRTW